LAFGGTDAALWRFALRKDAFCVKIRKNAIDKPDILLYNIKYTDV